MNKKYISVKVKGTLVRATLEKEKPTNEELVHVGKLYSQTIRKVYAKDKSKKYNVLMDTRKVNRPVAYAPSKMMNFLDEITYHPQTIKTAVLGEGILQEAFVFLIFSRFRDKRANFFTSEAKALDWLGY